MPAQSEAQRKLFGAALAMKRGDQPKTKSAAGKIASSVTEKKIREYTTKRKGQVKAVEKKMNPGKY